MVKLKCGPRHILFSFNTSQSGKKPTDISFGFSIHSSGAKSSTTEHFPICNARLLLTSSLAHVLCGTCSDYIESQNTYMGCNNGPLSLFLLLFRQFAFLAETDSDMYYMGLVVLAGS